VKAYLLAGGLGERLRPLTDRIPKCLAPINGEPLLGIWLRLCVQHKVSEVLINVSRHADLVLRFIDQHPWGLHIRLVSESSPIGNAGTVLANRDFVDGEASFFILYTDNLTDVSLTRMAAFHATHDAPLSMGLFHTPAPQSSGIVELNGDVIVGFQEKPAMPVGDLANAGVYVARPSLFEAIPVGAPIVDFGHDVFPRLRNRMKGYVIEEFLMDVGNPEALACAAREWAARSGRSREGSQL